MVFKVSKGEFFFNSFNHVIRGFVDVREGVYVINYAQNCTYQDFTVLDNLFNVYWDRID